MIRSVAQSGGFVMIERVARYGDRHVLFILSDGTSFQTGTAEARDLKTFQQLSGATWCPLFARDQQAWERYINRQLERTSKAPDARSATESLRSRLRGACRKLRALFSFTRRVRRIGRGLPAPSTSR